MIPLTKIVKGFGRALAIVVSIVLTVMLVRAFDVRSLPLGRRYKLLCGEGGRRSAVAMAGDGRTDVSVLTARTQQNF